MAQLVARYLGVVEAAGSNPVTQTRKTRIIGDYSLIVRVFILQFGDFTQCKTLRSKFKTLVLRIFYELFSISLPK